jgi:hypothetical protein
LIINELLLVGNIKLRDICLIFEGRLLYVAESTHPIDATLDLPSLLQAKKRAGKNKHFLSSNPSLRLIVERVGKRSNAGVSPFQVPFSPFLQIIAFLY